MRCVHSQREGAPDSTAAVTPKKIFPPACVIFTKLLKFSRKYGIISQFFICRKDGTYVSAHDFLYPLVLQLPAGHSDPGRIRIRDQLALFGIDSLSGYVLASRAPAGAWEPGAYLTREVQIPEETQPWFCSQETRPLLIMTEHGLGLLSKRYLPACGLGLLIHFHVPGKRGAAAVNRGLLQTDWIVSESVRAMGAGRCDAETYQVLTEAAYELSERLPALFPQPDRQTVRLRDVSDCICSMAAAIGCVAQEAPTRDDNTDRDQNRQVFCSRPRVWEAFLLYGLSLAWRMAADGGSLTFSLNAPGALTTETLSVRLDMELEYVRSAARAVCASSGVLNGDSGAFLTGYHCLTHASAYNGAILRYDLGNPVPAPDNRRLERRHLTLEMTMLNDPAVDSQMNLRSSATELFRF